MFQQFTQFKQDIVVYKYLHFLFWNIDSYKNQEFDIFLTDFRGLGFRKIAENLYDCLSFFTNQNTISKLPFFTIPLQNTFEIIKPFDYIK